MKYQSPPGTADGDPYVDGNLSAGVEGSEVPAAAIEHPQRELDHIIQFAGLTPDADDLQQVRKAVEAIVSAITGGSASSDYLLVSQARVRLPIFPEILSADGRMNVSSPAAGTILVPPSVDFMHRGVYSVSTSEFSEAQRTFTTNANKTYHVRWSSSNGLELKDVSDVSYNPTSVAESDVIFDSKYDDMLIARVVTDASNNPTITNLMNRPFMNANGEAVSAMGNLGIRDSEGVASSGYSGNSIQQGVEVQLGFARKPDAFLRWINDVHTAPNTNGEFNFGVRSNSRYSIMVWGQGDADINIGWCARA